MSCWKFNLRPKLANMLSCYHNRCSEDTPIAQSSTGVYPYLYQIRRELKEMFKYGIDG